MAVAFVPPIVADAEDRVGLRIDHVEANREFLTKLGITTTPDTRSFGLDDIQAFFLDTALHQSRQGNVFQRPKVNYGSGEILRINIPPNSDQHDRTSVWDAEHGSRFTLTPTITGPGMVDLVLRPSTDGAQAVSVAVPSGRTTAFMLEANATQVRLLFVRPHVY